jgi:glycine betaine/proline transport system ATP-binding protein
MPVVRFDHVDVVFGPRPREALERLDRGMGRSEILAETGNVVGVQDACLEVEAGELCVLMGLSGSGKSSLLRCVNGLNKIARGRLLVRDGDQEVDVASCDKATLRRLRMHRISMVFQQFALMPWRTVRDNVAFGLELRGVPRAERNAVVERVVELVGLGAWIEKYPSELSGGMQQRVGLARAFATDADILLMDEPFSALDPLIRARLQDELCALQRDLDKTIIFVSHDLDEALKLGDRIAIMESGRIVQTGPPEAIVTEPADDYVASFVANVNPLNVLRGATIMAPLHGLPRRGNDTVELDELTACRLDDGGRPVALLVNGAERPVCRGPEPGPGEAATAPLDVAMRRALELRHRTRGPVLLCGADGRLAGVIGDQEIIAALLREKRVGGY